jgi:hypothetical protein
MSTASGTTRRTPARRTEVLRLPRTTGAMSGFLILLLGVWGGLIPFVGPYFHYAFGGYQHWHWTSQRLWLNVVPGAVAVIGGLMLMRAHTRVGGLTAGWVALAAGVWFAVGPSVSILWHHNIYAIGAPMGGHTRQMLEWIGYFYGLGALIIGLAAFAMGRFVSRPRVVAEVADAAVAGAGAGSAVAEAPVAEHAAVADREPVAYREPVADRAAVAGEPVAEDRAPVADEPVARDRAPVADEPVADEPVARDRALVADEPVAEDRAPMADDRAPLAEDRAPLAGERAPVADEPATVADRAPVADEPVAGSDTAPAGTAYPSQTQTGMTGRRRSGGLLGRFRRQP